MSTENNILLITDNSIVSDLIKNKLLLLRNIDNFSAAKYEKAFSIIKKEKPCIIFYYLDKGKKRETDFINFINKMHQNSDLAECQIIPVFSKQNDDMLCTAFEHGISDFLNVKSTDTEFTLRVIWALQKKEMLRNIETKKNILAQLDIIDIENGLYTKNYINKILKTKSEKTKGAFAAVAPDVNTRNILSPAHLASIIKKNIRATDIVGFSNDFKLYLWFEKTKAKDTTTIFSKIKNELPKNCTISAGIVEMNETPFEEAEKQANKFLAKALLKGNSFLVARSSTNKQIKSIEHQKPQIKNFKLFKQAFHKKIECIVAPLFYQTQKRIEEKLFKTNIQYKTEENNCYFMLENEERKSIFELTYPGYTKINIDISHEQEFENISNKRLSLDISEITTSKLGGLLEDFINEFQNKSY